MTRERRVCKISGASWGGGCLAPAGRGIPGFGIAEGDGNCRGTCHHCGEPVCSKCSKITTVKGARRRFCEDCLEELARFPQEEAAEGAPRAR